MKRMRVSQKGQTIVLFALGLLALLAMAALLVDGGQTYMHRRQAQAAADAGALAGAKELCARDFTGAIDRAKEYVIQNGAIPSPDPWFITPDPDNPDKKELVVEAHIAQKSFFAQLIGLNEIDVIARAASGCYSPGQMSVLPVAWSCKAPSNETSSVNEDQVSCSYQTHEWTEIQDIEDDDPDWFETEGNVLSGMYIVMNADPLSEDIDCTVIDCDIDNDGEDDFVSHAARSWLDLDGGSSGNALPDWMENGIGIPISIHTWYSGFPGNRTPGYHAAEDLQGEIVILPVFDHYCPYEPTPGTQCRTETHPSDDPDTVMDGGNGEYFHIIDFVPFYISCVSVGGGPGCPGIQKVCEQNIENPCRPNDLNSLKPAIEGYFVTGYDINPGEGVPGDDDNFDSGIYVRSLTQ